MTLQSGPFSVHANMIGMAKHRRETNRRRETGHRLLFYISQGTSSKYPDWRNATINFLWDLYEIRDKNPAISVVVHKVDGITIYHDATPIAFFTHASVISSCMRLTDGYCGRGTDDRFQIYTRAAGP